MMIFSSNKNRNQEGLRLARLLMTLSSLSPLFILWAIHGQKVIPNILFISGCLTIAFLPTICLWIRFIIARENNDTKPVTVGSIEDHKSYVLSYLFATLFPFYRDELETFRDLLAMLFALILIIFLFFHLNLHYLNILFPILGYQAFKIWAPIDNNPYTGQEPVILITYRRFLNPGSSYTGYRLSNTVLLEVQT